jgi:hypothetical protein
MCRLPRGRALAGLVLAVLLAAALGACAAPAQATPCSATATPALPPAGTGSGQATFDLPSIKGLNYDGPAGAGGQWLGTRWLRAGTSSDSGWNAARPRLQADLDFIASHQQGQVVRVFIGLDQLMVWNSSSGFVRFNAAALGNLEQAFEMFDAHHLKMLAVVFDQEEVSSPGNFHFQALDCRHAAMRSNYLTAVNQFFHRFGTRPTVAGWDLFNEAYNSLGKEGGLSRPPSDDPVSPNYPDATVHAWIEDLYRAAKSAAPHAWLTVSDTTELYWNDQPDVAKYDGAADYYDIHVYDDHPSARDWAHTLRKPYLLGEVAGDIDHGFKDQSINSQVVGFWLSHARALGIRAVLAHSSDGSVYSLGSGTLTPTGRVIEAAG